MPTHSLPWSGVKLCLDALREPKRETKAIEAIATEGMLGMPRARTYLETAIALRLVAVDQDDRCVLAIAASRPEELLRASTLIRLFHRWQDLGKPKPLELLKDPSKSFGVLGAKDQRLLRTAQSLASHLSGKLDDVPPDAGLLLELVRLWAENHEDNSKKSLLDATEAFGVFDIFLRETGIHHDGRRGSVDRFTRCCMSLLGKNLIRVSHIQYVLGNDRPYAEFRTRLGFIKWLSAPAKAPGLDHAQPFQAKWKLVSSG